MKILYAVVLLTLSALNQGQELEDNGIVILTEKTFTEFIKSKDNVLVKFYAPDCKVCKSFDPEYTKIAKKLIQTGSSIALAKVNAVEETTLSNDHTVTGYPTLKLFKNGVPIKYLGGRTAEEVVTWLNKHTGPLAHILKEIEEAKALIAESQVITVGFFKDQSSEAAQVFLQVAATDDKIPFGITSEERIFEHFSAKDGDIFMFKKYDDKLVQFKNELNEKNLRSFLKEASRPLLIEFNIHVVQMLMVGDVQDFLVLFLSNVDENPSGIVEEARSVAKKFKEKMLFITADPTLKENQLILQFMKVKEHELPAMRIGKNLTDLKVFQPKTSEITAETIERFVRDYFDGHLASESLPDDWNKGPVYTLVASNFDEVVFDADKHVLVEFYAPWCKACIDIAPIYEKVGKYFKRNDKVIIAKMDATANSLEHTVVERYPTIKLYPKGGNEVLEYEARVTFKDLIKFVQQGDPEITGYDSDDKDEL
ncbi:protein disulfide-isomerase-like [Photinus pyralis]|uniref:protein disulfide-isomerase-like n=1 Tax=Photinus pyralis TaxID=7054 RepID=UPI0012673744|nr:protein disulfide-isomerase-like [Photinus pyralis]